MSFADTMEISGEQYRLTSVLYHQGRSAYDGHYVSEVLEWMRGKWWYCDDCSKITADAKLDDSGYYSLSMTCPDGQIEDIDLSSQLVTDRQWIRKQLPGMCRKHCDQVFGSRE